MLSLPRAGSTLLQRLMLASGRCATLGEPSLLLRFLGGDEVIARRATYWESLVETAEADIRKEWPEFDASYREGVAALMQRVYHGLAGGKEWFLDKTPRYTLIAEELRKTFPDAKFVVLWRHPLAVAASICQTYRDGSWCPDEFGIDLHEGLGRLMRFAEAHRESICEVRYEDLVSEPGPVLKRLGDYLGWPELEAAGEEELPASAGGTLGDSTGVKSYSKVSQDSRDKWIGQVDNWYRRAWCRDYWSSIDSAGLGRLGYEMPDEIASPGWWSGGVIKGVGDMLSARRRIRRRIEHPTWLPRFSKEFRRKRGYGVLFR
ncbi:hypothetical protein HAHE_37890 [Haloferula helveola]|uniref:Sulfotransferase family protein n=1 Tax=Haloferula helveola TaxID=490095 RepID=A0ABN6H8D2_9BACT|nr:hypothetical protein HAHE_37890 [Haloferula helveola]